jgi:two-component system, chemotaxis family, CheB/CheR fusion protein
VVAVRDNGIGIEKDMLSRVFDLFVQVPGSLDRSRGGLGIGLTLVRRLIALHEGSIEAFSEGIGKGSEFVVRFTTTEQRPKVQPPQQATARTGRRILLVEDNSDSAEMLAETLRLDGFVVRVASDGEAGVAAALEFDPEVVLLDIGLPKMDGYSVARELRPRLPKAILIAFSGYGDEAHRVRSREAGFDAHLVKPVELAELIPILASARR